MVHTKLLTLLRSPQVVWLTPSVANGVNDAFLTAFETDTAAVGTAARTSFAFHLDGGDDLGIGAGDTVGTGLVGDDIIAAQQQQRSELSLIFPDIAPGDLGDPNNNFGQNPPVRITIGSSDQPAGSTTNITGFNELTSFFFSDGGGATEAAIGDTLEDTLDNMVATINNYVGSKEENYVLNQIEAVREGNAIVIRSLDYGDVNTLEGNSMTIAYGDGTNNTVTGSSLTNIGPVASVAEMDTGDKNGVSTTGVTNDAFIGQIQGFEASLQRYCRYY